MQNPGNLFKFETHLHTSDISLCARSTIYDWVEFYKLQFPQVKTLILTNHSYQPGLYRFTDCARDINIKKYDDIKDLNIVSGIEANILRNGMLDVNADNIIWLMGALHPLPHEYSERNGTIEQSADAIEKTLISTIEANLIDILAHPTDFIKSEDLSKINWHKIFNACKENGIIIDLNLLAPPPNWWVKMLVDSGVFIALGSDFHGMYHFRYFKVEGISNEEESIRQIVLNGNGRNSYDSLNDLQKNIYDTMYKTKKLPSAFYDWFYQRIHDLTNIGLDSNLIINSHGDDFLNTFIKTVRKNRKEVLNDLL